MSTTLQLPQPCHRLVLIQTNDASQLHPFIPHLP